MLIEHNEKMLLFDSSAVTVFKLDCGCSVKLNSGSQGQIKNLRWVRESD